MLRFVCAVGADLIEQDSIESLTAVLAQAGTFARLVAIHFHRPFQAASFRAAVMVANW